ncbi:hypothetical protein GP486_002083 [Trichoglossum hirsutum]|uniref:Uncharacterized protein n=1 Tax=Trichoglossum hirsutum TaxID=265104 RepID=A0A9P8RSF0_9PEZI|nr:hypothetical protein GP486_002083 [Trichoglossum hirsutum]
MFEFGDKKIPESKCYVTHGTLGRSWIELNQIPTRRKPFSTIDSHPFNHTVELALPEELYEIMHQDLEREIPTVKYSRVILALSQLLEGDFFNQYIKIGNILMLSEGRLGVDNVYSLSDEGEPRLDGVKVVEINLRLPSMLHGKKGFERIVWSFKNVLKDPLSWLFCDLTPKDGDGPIKEHHPVTLACEAQICRLNNLNVPVLNPPEKTLASFLDDFNDYAVNLQEWLALISIESPRIRVDDKIDPFLSRYEVELDTTTPEANMVRMRWRGMLPARWIAQLFAVCITRSIKNTDPTAWFALTVHGFRDSPVSWKSSQHGDSLHGENGYTVMKLPPRGDSDSPVEYVLWEIVGGLDEHS